MNKKVIASIIGGVVLVAGLLTGFFLLTKSQQDARISATPATTVSLFTPDRPAVGDIAVVDVEVNTNENSIIIAQIDLTFDPTILEAVSATPGTFFPSPQQEGPSIDNEAGTISYTVFILPGGTPKKGAGTLASVTFNTLSGGSSTVDFAPTTEIGASSETTNVLISTSPVTVTVADGTPTASPTPTPTTTPTATPLSDATPTPSTGSATPIPGTASPTPSPLPGTATPIATTSASPTPAATPAPQPVTGSAATTFIVITAGLLLLVAGTAVFAL